MSDSHSGMNEVEYDRKGRMIGKEELLRYRMTVYIAVVVGMILYGMHCFFAVCALACRRGLEAMERKVELARQESPASIRRHGNGSGDNVGSG